MERVILMGGVGMEEAGSRKGYPRCNKKEQREGVAGRRTDRDINGKRKTLSSATLDQ